jgi:hypothetical protein
MAARLRWLAPYAPGSSVNCGVVGIWRYQDRIVAHAWPPRGVTEQDQANFRVILTAVNAPRASLLYQIPTVTRSARRVALTT